MTPKQYIKKQIEIDERCQHFTREQWMKYYLEDETVELQEKIKNLEVTIEYMRPFFKIINKK